MCSNCSNLSAIGDLAFENNNLISTIDFSGCPITTVSANAFNGCSNLQTIYVKGQTAKSAIETALNAANISGVSVNIKN